MRRECIRKEYTIVRVIAPQIWGGYVCQHFARGDVCQLLAKIQPKAGKRPFVLKIQ